MTPEARTALQPRLMGVARIVTRGELQVLADSSVERLKAYARREGLTLMSDDYYRIIRSEMYRALVAGAKKRGELE